MILENELQRRGALDALKVLLTAKTRNIVDVDDQGQKGDSGDPGEQKKSVKNSTKQAQDSDQAAQGVDSEEKRVARINDQEGVEQDIQDMQIERDLRNNAHDQQVRAKTTAELRASGATGGIGGRPKQIGSFQDLIDDIHYAMASQVARTRKQKDSYSRVNASYAGSGLLMPGHNDSKDKKTPVLDIYFDNSGSWGESDVEKGNECLDKLTEMEDRKQLKINRFYFANTVHSDSRWDGGWSEGGTSAYPEILQNIKKTNATNVIIMSDNDLDRALRYQVAHREIQGVTQITGCVWWLWSGSSSPNATKYLQGLSGNFSYTLN